MVETNLFAFPNKITIKFIILIYFNIVSPGVGIRYVLILGVNLT